MGGVEVNGQPRGRGFESHRSHQFFFLYFFSFYFLIFELTTVFQEVVLVKSGG